MQVLVPRNDHRQTAPMSAAAGAAACCCGASADGQLQPHPLSSYCTLLYLLHFHHHHAVSTKQSFDAVCTCSRVPSAASFTSRRVSAGQSIHVLLGSPALHSVHAARALAAPHLAASFARIGASAFCRKHGSRPFKCYLIVRLSICQVVAQRPIRHGTSRTTDGTKRTQSFRRLNMQINQCLFHTASILIL